MTYGARPFGLRDVKLTPLPTGDQVDLPASRMLTLTARIVSEEMSGDDSIVAMYGAVDAMEWELEAGGISLEAYAVLIGATVTTAGSTPNRTRSLTLAGGTCLPYFKIYGKAVSDDCTSDIHAKLWKAKVTDLDGKLEAGTFYVTTCKGIAVTNLTDGIVTWIQNETAADLPAS